MNRWGALVGICLALGVFAQTQSRLSGSITDDSGAVVVGARVTAKNVLTGVSTEAVTGESGNYQFPILNPGEYEVSVESAGFKKVVQAGVILETGLTRTVDLKLTVGAVSETVQVTATAPLLESETSSIGQLIERKSVLNMPLESRRTAGLVRMLGAVTFARENAGEQVPMFSMGGGRSQNQMWQLDGAVVQNMSLGVAQLQLNPPAESLQEFKAEMNNFSAEFGRAGGGLILMTTRSGTNQYHGAAYEFLRNQVLDTRTFFAPRKAPLRYNIFGGSFGGPVIKDRTFFFVNYEGARRRDGVTVSGLIVPNLPERTGDFSNRRDRTILDPSTGQPFPGGIIPANRIDPIARQLVALYPAPNLASDITRAPSANYTVNVSDKLTQDYLTARVDHALSSKDRIFGRYSVVAAPQEVASAFPDAIADTRAGVRENKIHATLGSWIHNFTPTVLNEARYAWSSRMHINRAAGSGSGFNGKLGLPNVDPNNFPVLNVTGQTGMSTTPNERIQNPILTHHFVDNVTMIRGNHTLKMGYELRYSLNKDKFSQTGGGTFSFNDRATNSGMASLLLGFVTSAGRVQPDLLEARTDYHGTYFQDDWKVTKNLTLNLGLRWELDTPRWERIDNRQSGFDGTVVNPIAGVPGIVTYSGRDGRSKYAHDFDPNNFGPRIGFAWKAKSNTVIRGGYGVSYLGIYFGAVVNQLSQGFGDNANFSGDGGVTAVFQLRNGLPAFQREAIGPGYGAVRLGQAPRVTPDFISPNHVNGYAQQYNLTVQRQLGGHLMIEGAYLANLGRKLGGAAVDINMIPLVNGRGPATQSQALRPFPQYSGVTRLTPNWGSSTYHAMNIKVERRYSNGFNLLANYTWAKFLDNIEGGSEFAGGEGNGYTHIQLRGLDRSYSGNDIRHRVIASSVYELPIGKGKKINIQNGFANAVIGGWSLGTIAEFFTGAPWGSIEQTNLSNTYSGSPRPQLVCDPNNIASGRSRNDSLNQWFNTACLVAPGVGNFGNAARSLGFGPGTASVDTSVNKRWDLTERYKLLFRGDIFNVPNYPLFNTPNAVRGRGDFGRITGTRGTGRQIQLNLRLEF